MTNDLSKYATKGEARVARRLVRAALYMGYSISVYDSEEWTVKRANNARAVLDALATTGEDTLRLRDAAGEPVGSFFLVWGNDESGDELIADHTDNELCAGLVAVAEGRATIAPPIWMGEA